MQCVIQDSVLGQKQDVGEYTDAIQVKPGVELRVTDPYWLLMAS